MKGNSCSNTYICCVFRSVQLKVLKNKAVYGLAPTGIGMKNSYWYTDILSRCHYIMEYDRTVIFPSPSCPGII